MLELQTHTFPKGLAERVDQRGGKGKCQLTQFHIHLLLQKLILSEPQGQDRRPEYLQDRGHPLHQSHLAKNLLRRSHVAG
jgi:hypothetical protein